LTGHARMMLRSRKLVAHERNITASTNGGLSKDGAKGGGGASHYKGFGTILRKPLFGALFLSMSLFLGHTIIDKAKNMNHHNHNVPTNNLDPLPPPPESKVQEIVRTVTEVITIPVVISTDDIETKKDTTITLKTKSVRRLNIKDLPQDSIDAPLLVIGWKKQQGVYNGDLLSKAMEHDNFVKKFGRYLHYVKDAVTVQPLVVD
jgi:hypothetical protein